MGIASACLLPLAATDAHPLLAASLSRQTMPIPRRERYPLAAVMAIAVPALKPIMKAER